MIPDFKTYIKESVWADMHKRSNGSRERKEDDINLMGEMELFDYIDIHLGDDLEYYNTGSFVQNTDDSIVVEVIEDISIYYTYIKEEPHDIFIVPYQDKKIDAAKLEDDFYVEKRGRGYKITEKDRTICNKTYIRLIKFFIDNRDSITESVWSDIHKRSNGELERKEDKLNMNTHMMNPVDLGSDVPVYFADIDLEVNGENEFTWEEVLNFLPEIEKTGWKLLCGPRGVQHLFYNGNQPPRFNDDDYEKQWIPGKGGILRSKETNEELHFYTDNRYGINYWCADDDYKPGDLDTISIKQKPRRFVTQRGFEVGDPNDYNGCLIRTNNFMVYKKCRIRLIKDK